MKKVTIFLMVLLIGQLSYGGVFSGRYPSARAMGMSDAYVAIANDVWAPYYNPAGLADLNRFQFATALQRPFNQTFLSNAFLGAALPLPGKYGTVGVTVETYGVKYQGYQLSNETTATFSHGFFLLNDVHSTLSVGYNVKYYYWQLGHSVGGLNLGSAGAFGLDLGLQASLYQRTYAGVYVYNINTPTMGAETAYDLPVRVAAGFAYRPLTGLVTAISLDKTIGYDTEVKGGIEFFPVKWLAFRGGASTNPNRFSLGFGLNYHGFFFDYSFQNHPVLPETHKISLMYQL